MKILSKEEFISLSSDKAYEYYCLAKAQGHKAQIAYFRVNNKNKILKLKVYHIIRQLNFMLEYDFSMKLNPDKNGQHNRKINK